MSVLPGELSQFEGYEIDRARWQLRYGSEVLPLNRKTFDLLLYLVDHADRVVTKDELLRVLWPEQFIEESNLTQQVFLLRKALGRHLSGAKIIETVPGRGYRFAVPVQTETTPKQGVGQTTGISSPPGTQTSVRGAERPDNHRPGPPGHSLHEFSTAAATSTERTGSKARLGTGAGPFQTRWLLLTTTTLAAVLVTWFLLARFRHPARLSVSAYAQITHDGHAKSIGGTDGSRIYFTRLEKSAIAQVSISGKAEALMPLALTDPWSGDVSPDGSTLLIVSQASGQGPGTALWALQLINGTLHRLGHAMSAAWSPDGEAIVYSSANGELSVMRSDGADAHRIALVGGNVSSLAWSPDGRTIRFSKEGLLWQIAPDGSNLKQLLPGWVRSPNQSSGGWSSSGTYFFVSDGQIWALDNEKEHTWKSTPYPVQLTHGPTVWDHPVPSRDGKKIFASGRTRRGELVRFDSAEPKAFLAGISAEFVTFSTAANAVAYVTYPDGILWRANVDGSDPRQLTDSAFYPKSICWSPDGSRIAFVDRTAEKASAVFVLPSNGTGTPRRLMATDTATQTDPSWSPNGRELIFSTAPNVGASARSDLRIFNLDTGKTATVSGSEGLLVPRWSPDGHAVAAMTLDAKSLKFLDLRSGRWSTFNTGAVSFPEWSHDGRWIYYVRWTANPALMRLRVADGTQEILANLTGEQYTGAYTLWMGLDPSDRPMMLRDAGTDDIYALTLHRE